MQAGKNSAAFSKALTELIGIATAHLSNALKYTLLLPKGEKGMRRFCLWALGMAVLTLRKIDRHKDFTRGNKVKITRRSVKATITVTNILVTHDRSLRLLFDIMTRSLTPPGLDLRKLSPARHDASPG